MNPTCNAPEGCDLPRSGSTNYCRPHRKYAKRRPADWKLERPVCKLDGCEARIRSDNKVGYCGPHHFKSKSVPRNMREADWRECGELGCSAKLRPHNKSGYCPPHSARSARRNRRALMRDAWIEDVSTDIVWRRDNGTCHLCGDLADADDWHLDHVIPLARGGSHSYLNCAVSHPACNLKKSDNLSPSALGYDGEPIEHLFP